MKALRVVVAGRVQGVGYRAWTEAAARRRGLAGWVRNRLDGSVEALLAGEEAALDAMLEAMRRGPPAARVDDLTVEDAEAPAAPGFEVRPTR
ncbi:MAG: acylphosphatase [Methylobacteriaceae bacterium]|nr:acylphosphatase [Methylobacteriaceae bacterium]